MFPHTQAQTFTVCYFTGSSFPLQTLPVNPSRAALSHSTLKGNEEPVVHGTWGRGWETDQHILGKLIGMEEARSRWWAARAKLDILDLYQLSQTVQGKWNQHPHEKEPQLTDTVR